MKISIIDIIHSTSVDGPGLRTSVYCAGCEHKCKGCHNPESWDVGSGREVSTDDVVENLLKHKYEDVTFSGGDPMYQALAFADIAKKVKEKSEKNIWCYTGYRFEQLIGDEKAIELLQYVDILVDGRYEEGERDTSLRFRGSKNQRIVDVRKSLEMGEVVEYRIQGIGSFI